MQQLFLRTIFCSILASGMLNSLAQCPTAATFVVKESRCRENGSITVNATPAGSYTYEIISGPELAALSSSNVFGGLGAGNYVVSVHGSGACGTLNQAVTVPGNYQDPGLLTATVDNITCPGVPGAITANQPSNGRAPYRYALISGPVTRASQPSTVFNGLPEGQYTLQAFDSCGVVRTSQFIIGVDTGDFEAYVYNWEVEYLNCNDLMIPTHKNYLNTSAHTLLKVWYVSPSGDTLKVNSFNSESMDYDTLANRTHDYGEWQVLVFDECGRMRVSTFYHYERVGEMYVETYNPACSGISVAVYNEWRFGVGVRYNIRSCTTGELLYTEYQPPNSGQWHNDEFQINYDSCYFFEVVSDCGERLTRTFTSPSRAALEVEACGYQSCRDVNKGEIWMHDVDNSGLRPVVFTILTGPAAEIGRTTQMVDRWESWASFGDLESGTYSVGMVDACGRRDTVRNIQVQGGVIRDFQVTQSPNCSGGSNLHVNITSNQGSDCNNDYYLYRVTGTDPSIEAFNVVNNYFSSTAVPGNWEADYFNVTASSVRFTINSDYGYGCGFDTVVAIQTYKAPTLNNINGYVCSTNGIGTINYNVNNGKPPFQFRIKSASSTVWGPWQDSSLFTGITAGVYDVNVVDACPNGSIRSLNFLSWSKSDVTFSAPCANIGSSVTLSADPPVGFVQYQWLYNNTVVGSGPTYTIPNFTPAKEGMYKLRQVFRGGVCSDSVSKWLLTCSILPLTFGEFSGHLLSDKVQLNWKTLADVDGLQFIVERSTDGVHFSKIGTVPNYRNADGSLYRFTDGSPKATNYYRIGFYTNAGSVSYSHVVKIKKGSTSLASKVQVAPSPFRDQFKVQISARVSQSFMIRLYDAGGKEMLQRKVLASVGENVYAFNDELQSLPSGYYILEVNGDEFIQREKVVKQ